METGKTYKALVEFYSGGRFYKRGEQFFSHANIRDWIKRGLVIEIKIAAPVETKTAVETEAAEDGQRKPAVKSKRAKQQNK